MSLIDKKYLFMPLNTKLSLSYNHVYAPFYSQAKFYSSRNDNINVLGEANTHYKRGFNGKLMFNYIWGRYKSGLGDTKFTNLDYRLSLSYNTSKLYASCGLLFRDYRMQENKTHDVFFDIEARYNYLIS